MIIITIHNILDHGELFAVLFSTVGCSVGVADISLVIGFLFTLGINVVDGEIFVCLVMDLMVVFELDKLGEVEAEMVSIEVGTVGCPSIETGT
jgi:hypothetical protein